MTDTADDASMAGSYWLADAADRSFEPLTYDLTVDVVVVGAGITGLTTALHLTEAGRTVAVVEADRVGAGTSGHTTAKLTAQHGLTYATLASRVGRRGAKQYADANQAAIEEVGRRVAELDVDASFERTSAYVYASEPRETEDLREEASAAKELGLPAEYVDEPDGPIDMAGALRFRDQAQFHPYRYLLALAREIDDATGFVFENTRAVDVDTGPPARVETDRDRTILADDVVLASLFPIADRTGYFSRMHPSRAYLVVAELAEPPAPGMYLSSDESPWTFRPLPADDRDLLLVGGQSHTLAHGEGSARTRYRQCTAFAREHFPVRSIEHRWTAHDYVPVDGVPFIGKRGPLADNVYVGTGFNKWGMTGGTAAGMILAGLIVEGSHRWADVFDPMRVVPSAASTFLRENLAVGTRWIGDRAHTEATADRSEPLGRGEGTVIRHRGRPTAVARDEDGELHAMSAVCPHMWCLVEWNDVDHTWDCPCHGSRFDLDGTMRYGPAVDDLDPREL